MCRTGPEGDGKVRPPGQVKSLAELPFNEDSRYPAPYAGENNRHTGSAPSYNHTAATWQEDIIAQLRMTRAIVGDEPSDHDLIHCLQQTRGDPLAAANAMRRGGPDGGVEASGGPEQPPGRPWDFGRYVNPKVMAMN